MPTLSQISSETRILVKWCGITLGAVIFLFILFKLGVMTKNALYPTPPPPPTVGYNKLPQIDFPRQEGSKNFVFYVDTVSGKLPNFPDRVSVFRMIKPQADLLALKKAEEKLSRIKFDLIPTLVSKNVYRFTTSSPFPKTLLYN
ncbi:MAG: hypothetical protein COX78_03620, partial [Candidatus Levybacteria bacterium CG_4_10_14_0_2_um_filter_35_8]